MSLAEKVRTTEGSSLPGPACAIRRYLVMLEQDDADALLHVIYKRLDLAGSEVSDLLAEEGISVSPYVVNRHRTGRCKRCKG